MKNKLTIIFLATGILLAVGIPYFSKAQTLTDYSSNSRIKNNRSSRLGGPNPGGNPDVPIDGGISLLVAAGAAYGIKKARDSRKK